MRALVVEDDEVTRKLTNMYLKPFGHCDLAEDGLKGLELYKDAVKTGVFYDVVCLDIMMPGMDGITVLKEIRKFEDEQNLTTTERARVLMMTAVADAPVVGEAFKSGCQGYLIKPLERDELVRHLTQMKLILQT